MSRDYFTPKEMPDEALLAAGEALFQVVREACGTEPWFGELDAAMRRVMAASHDLRRGSHRGTRAEAMTEVRSALDDLRRLRALYLTEDESN